MERTEGVCCQTREAAVGVQDDDRSIRGCRARCRAQRLDEAAVVATVRTPHVASGDGACGGRGRGNDRGGCGSRSLYPLVDRRRRAHLHVDHVQVARSLHALQGCCFHRADVERGPQAVSQLVRGEKAWLRRRERKRRVRGRPGGGAFVQPPPHELAHRRWRCLPDCGGHREEFEACGTKALGLQKLASCLEVVAPPLPTVALRRPHEGVPQPAACQARTAPSCAGATGATEIASAVARVLDRKRVPCAGHVVVVEHDVGKAASLRLLQAP
eukprot:3848907-Prymnesium_polylepis.1